MDSPSFVGLFPRLRRSGYSIAQNLPGDNLPAGKKGEIRARTCQPQAYYDIIAVIFNNHTAGAIRPAGAKRQEGTKP